MPCIRIKINVEPVILSMLLILSWKSSNAQTVAIEVSMLQKQYQGNKKSLLITPKYSISAHLYFCVLALAYKTSSTRVKKIIVL